MGNHFTNIRVPDNFGHTSGWPTCSSDFFPTEGSNISFKNLGREKNTYFLENKRYL